jgi:RNA recognition motif-containing protein
MNIQISNLHPDISEARLWDMFTMYGNVNAVNIATETITGTSKGYALIDMPERKEGELAIRLLNKISFMNRFLEVRELKSGTQRHTGYIAATR